MIQLRYVIMAFYTKSKKKKSNLNKKIFKVLQNTKYEKM